MNSARKSRSEVDILSYAFDLGCVGEIGTADGFSDQIVVVIAGLYYQPLLFADVQQLVLDFSDFAHRFYLHKALTAPFS